MYETLIMLKPETRFSVDELERVVRDVAAGGTGAVERNGSSIILKTPASYLQIDYSEAPSVLEESEEISRRFGLECRRCRSRFEMHGEDVDMQLFNDYVLINERLGSTHKFFIFSQAEGKPFST